MKKHEITMTEEEVKQLITAAVKDTLLTLGCQSGDPIEMQKDFAHLREGRLSVEALKKKGMLTALGFVILSALGLALKAFLGD